MGTIIRAKRSDTFGQNSEGKIRNSNVEIRIGEYKNQWVWEFGHSCLFRISDFDIWISALTQLPSAARPRIAQL